jgi:hypothetical protein
MSAPTISADVYSSQQAREYRDIMDIIHGRGEFGNDAYSHLMDKETPVLDTVNRVVNDARLQSSQGRMFLNKSLIQLATGTVTAVHDLYIDLMHIKSLHDILIALMVPTRRPYMGIVIIVISLILMIVLSAA